MAALAKEKISLTGLNGTYSSAAGGGDTFPVGANTFLNIKNGSGAPITVTVDSKKNCDQGEDHNSVTVVTNGEERLIGPFSSVDRWGNPTTKLADLTYSGVTSLTVGVFEL